MMIGKPIWLNFFHIQCEKYTIPLTFNEKKCTMANAKTFCFKGNQRFEFEVEAEKECLKSKMAEKYSLNIIMTVCQIEKLPRFIKYWFLMIIEKMEVI